MKTHRRGFLAMLAGAIAAPWVGKKAKAALDPYDHIQQVEITKQWLSPVVTSARQTPGRIDFIDLKDWCRTDLSSVEAYFEFTVGHYSRERT